MKKIGIITLSGNYNYGNRLQNYAMQEVYKILGFEVEKYRIRCVRIIKQNFLYWLE